MLCVILYYFSSLKPKEPWHLKPLRFPCLVQVNTPHLPCFKQNHSVTRFSDPNAPVSGENWFLQLLPDLCESWACHWPACLCLFGLRSCAAWVFPQDMEPYDLMRCFTKTAFKIIKYLQMNWKLFFSLSLQGHCSVKCIQKIEGLRISIRTGVINCLGALTWWCAQRTTRCDISQFTTRGVSRRHSEPQRGERWEKKGQIYNIKFTRLIMP